MNNNVLGGIADSSEYLIGVVLLGESTGGASYDTLTASYASDIVELCLEGRTDLGVETTVVSTDNRYELVVASTHAATAEDALGVISYKVRGGVVDLSLRNRACKAVCILNAVLTAELLKLAVGAAYAGEASLVMYGKDELEVGLAALSDELGVGVNLKTLIDGVYASGNRSAAALYFYNAHTASADLVDVLKIAESRNLYTGKTCSLKNGRTGRSLYINTVDFYIDHVFHYRHTPFLVLADSLELTVVDTYAALYALSGVDCKGSKLMTRCDIVGSGDGSSGAVLSAETAADALVLIDNEGKEILTDACRALLINNVSYILITEETESGKNRVGSSLTETAEGVGLNEGAELFELLDIIDLALTLGDSVEDLVHSSGTDTAGSTLTAGLIDGEVEEELSDINHTVVLVHDDKTAGADHSADRCERIVIKGNVDIFSRYASAGRSAELCSLELLAVCYAAADFIDNGGKRSTHGDLNETCVVDLTAESEYLGTSSLLAAGLCKPLAALKDDLGDVCIGLNVVENGGLAKETLNCGEGRTGTGLTAVTLDGGHKRGLLTANECACTEAELEVEVEACTEDVLAQQAVFTSLTDSDLKTMDSDGVLSTNVDVTLGCADSIACDSHSFDNSMGVTFEDGTVHECTGVAFVSVTADILLVCCVSCCEAPLETGGESAAATTAKTGILDNLDNFLRSHFGKNLTESLITVHSDVLIDYLGVDKTAVTKSNSLLCAVEVGVVKRGMSACSLCLLFNLSGNVSINKTLNDTALKEMLLNDCFNVFNGNIAVEYAFGVYNNNGTENTKTEAAGLNELYFVSKTCSCEVLVECCLNFNTAGGSTTGTSADKHFSTNHLSVPPLILQRC